MADSLAQAADKWERLSAKVNTMGAAAARDIGRYGQQAYVEVARASHLLPPSLAATHGRIGGRNRAMTVTARVTVDNGHELVEITPNGDLWYVVARGREAKGSYAPLRWTKTGKIRKTKTRRGTPPLKPSPQLYQPAQRAVVERAPRTVAIHNAKLLGSVFA